MLYVLVLVRLPFTYIRVYKFNLNYAFPKNIIGIRLKLLFNHVINVIDSAITFDGGEIKMKLHANENIWNPIIGDGVNQLTDVDVVANLCYLTAAFSTFWRVYFLL